MTLVELMLALVILGVVGVVLINAMTSSSIAANKTISKSAAFYSLTTAAEAYSSFPYTNSNCSATASNPYSTIQQTGAVDSKIKVQVLTLVNNITAGTSSEWKWVTCGSSSDWSALSDATRVNLNDAYAGVQKILLTYQLGTATCPDPEEPQPNRCLTRTILKSDNNRNTPFTTVGSFRVWPTSSINLVTTESRLLGLKVVGLPSSTDQVTFIVSAVSSAITVAPKNDVGVNVTAGSTLSGASPYSFKVQACDATISLARSNPTTTDPAVACAQSTAFVSAQTTIYVNVFQKLTLGCPVAGCSFTGNAGYSSSVYQLTATGGNGQPITFSTTADPTSFPLTSDGKFSWTSGAPASPIQGTYDNLVPSDIAVTISQPGLTSTTTSIKVKLFSNPRFISPAQPPLPAETISFSAGSTTPYVLKAVGGDPSMNLAFSTLASSPVTVAFTSGSQGISSANMVLKSAQNVGRYSVPVTLSGAGWPVSSTYSLATIVLPSVNDPGLIEGSTGTAGSSTLTCTCTGSTNNTFRISSSAPTGFSISAAGVLSWAGTVAQGTYTIPVTVTSRVSSEDFVSAVRNVSVALYGPLVLTQPAAGVALTYDYGSTTGQALQAQGGKPTQQITIATSSGQFTVGSITGPVSGITSATLTPKSTSLPAVGQTTVPITLSGASAATASTSVTVRIRPVLSTLTISRMATFADFASVGGACSTLCSTAVNKKFALDSSFTTSGITLTSDGVLNWTASVPAGTYSIPIIVSGAGSNGIYVDSAATNITLQLTPRLTLTAPTSTVVAGAGVATTFALNAYGGNGTTASFALKNSSTNFTVATTTGSYNAATLTSVGSITVTATAPASTYVVPIILTGAGTSQNIEVSVTILVQPAFTITSTTASCSNFKNSTAASPCNITVTYKPGTGSGIGLKLMTAPTSPTNPNGFLWSTSAGNTTLPFPTSSSATSVTVSLYKKTSGSGILCGSSLAPGTINIVVQDAGSSATATMVVSVTC